MNPNNELHPKYVMLLTSVYGKGSLAEIIPNGSVTHFADRSISEIYKSLDNVINKCNEDIAALKQTHTDELLELKLKLSNLIDTNYNLLQLLNKDTHAKD
jgi:hypothetical protein